MILLLDIGNTHTHLGLANSRRVVRHADIPTGAWFGRKAVKLVARFAGNHRRLEGVTMCSVVPRATPKARKAVSRLGYPSCLELTAATLRGLGLDYPKPQTIGPDRLANAVAARRHFGAPALVVDFGTAVTFDVVSQAGNFVGGIIAPGLAAMTDYLHEKTAVLPRIRVRQVKNAIGKSTEAAMLAGVILGYPGLVRELITQLKRELKVRRLPIIATGGYAKLMAARLPEITAVEPLLTLEGLRLFWQAHRTEG